MGSGPGDPLTPSTVRGHFSSFFSTVGIEPISSHMLGRNCTSELHPQPEKKLFLFIVFFLWMRTVRPLRGRRSFLLPAQASSTEDKWHWALKLH